MNTPRPLRFIVLGEFLLWLVASAAVFVLGSDADLATRACASGSIAVAVVLATMATVRGLVGKGWRVRW